MRTLKEIRNEKDKLEKRAIEIEKKKPTLQEMIEYQNLYARLVTLDWVLKEDNYEDEIEYLYNPVYTEMD